MTASFKCGMNGIDDRDHYRTAGYLPIMVLSIGANSYWTSQITPVRRCHLRADEAGFGAAREVCGLRQKGF